MRSICVYRVLRKQVAKLYDGIVFFIVSEEERKSNKHKFGNYHFDRALYKCFKLYLKICINNECERGEQLKTSNIEYDIFN